VKETMETHIANIQIESIDSDFSNHDKQLSEIIRDVSTKIEGNDEKRRARLEISEFVSNEVNNLNLNDIRNKNDITFELKNLEFEAGFSASDNLFELGRIDFDLLRKKAHVRLVASIAHACYFIGVANKIRRNYFDIKNGILKQKSSLLLTEMNKEPGLKIGVIGGGRLGMQLSRALLEFASVQPSELRISTRQPELLSK
jgi:ribosomal protein S9